MSRRVPLSWIWMPLALEVLSLAGCARRPPLDLVPPARRAEMYLRRHDHSCRDVRDFEAEGILQATRGMWTVEARGKVQYRSPDRLRVNVRNRGFLGIGSTEADILARGDSIYVSVEGQGLVWSGRTEETMAHWPGRAPLLLAFLEEILPGGPLSCPAEAEYIDHSARLPEGYDDLWQDVGGEVVLHSSPGSLERFLLLEKEGRYPAQSLLFGENRALVARVWYADYREMEGLWRPARIRLEYPDEGAEVIIQEERQVLNQGLSENLFVPPREEVGARGSMGGKVAEDRDLRLLLTDPHRSAGIR